MICLDTSVVIAAINGRDPRVRERLQAALNARTEVGIPVVTLYELQYGIRKSDRPERNLQALTTFMSLDVSLWPFEEADAEEAADIRAQLDRAGTPVGAYDVLIAAQARRRKATLVTANIREFTRVSGLATDDWTRG